MGLSKITYPITSERGDLFDVSMTIAMRIEVTGKATRDELENAFRSAVSCHEILNCKVRLDETGKAYYEYLCDPGFQSITFTDKDWKTIISEEEKKRFKMEEGELLRAFCYDHSENSFKILFMMHHLGGDGKSLVYFIETFMSCLSGKTCDEVKVRLLTPEDMPKGSENPFFIKAWVKNLNRKWKNEAGDKSFTFEDMDKAYAKFWKTHGTVITEEVIPEEAMSKILKECHENGVGYTAYYTTKSIEDKPGKQAIGYAVDGRIDHNRSMGNQATGISIDYEYNSRKSFWDNARAVQKLMYKKINSPVYKWFVLHFMASIDPNFVDSVVLSAAGAFDLPSVRKAALLMGYGEKKKDLSITNLTKLDIPYHYAPEHDSTGSSDGFTIDKLSFIAPVVSYGKNIIGISTMNGKTVVTRHVFEE